MSADPIPATGRIDIAGAAIRLGAGAAAFEVVRDIDLAVPPRQFVCLLGPSGCGKSTLLGALAGHLGLARGRRRLTRQPRQPGDGAVRQQPLGPPDQDDRRQLRTVPRHPGCGGGSG